MNRAEIRIELVKQLGRNDLVVDTTDYADKGANAVINAALVHLCNRVETPLSSHFLNLAVGQFSVLVRGVRRLDFVYATSSEGAQEKPLRQLSFQEFRSRYPKFFALGATSTTTDADLLGTPCSYTVAPTGVSFEMNRAHSEESHQSYLDSVGALFGDWYQMRSLLVAHAPEEAGWNLRVVGLFYDYLDDDEAVCYFSHYHPQLLISACAWVLEARQRNSQGMQDWNQYIETEVKLLDRRNAYDQLGADKIQVGG